MSLRLPLWSAILAVLFAGAAPAQDDVKKKTKGGAKAVKVEADDEPAAKKSNLPPTPKAGRVYMRPAFARLGLDAKQKAQYEKIYLANKAKIDAIEAELDAAKKKRDDELEAILTPAQKKELKEFEDAQEEARKEKAKKKADDEKAKKAKKAKKDDG